MGSQRGRHDWVTFTFNYFQLLSRLVCWLPNPSTSEYDFIWRQGPYREYQVKVRFIRRGFSSILTSVLMQEENLDTEICAEGRQCKETQGGDGRLQAKERGLQQTLLSQPSKGTNLPICWPWTSSLQNCEKINFCCASCWSLSHLVIPYYGRPSKTNIQCFWKLFLPFAVYINAEVDWPSMNRNFISNLKLPQKKANLSLFRSGL